MHIQIADAARIHHALADPLRIRILALVTGRELCVCEIVAVLGEAQYTVSRHLGILRRAGLVRVRREGTWMHYAAADDLAPEWRSALRAVGAAAGTLPEVRMDLQRLRRIHLRPPAGRTTCPRLRAKEARP